jgi:D-glycero-alpha-D-manno-heptose 1-phosphate guanylyltransferase
MSAGRIRNCRNVTMAIILAGGRGTRLGDICSNVPKPMIPILGRPFLDYVVEYLAGQGIERIIISSGYLGDQIEAFFRNSRYNLAVRCMREPQPMGTGGALSYVASVIDMPPLFLVINGDSLVPFHLSSLVAAIENRADASIVGVRCRDSQRFGTLMVDEFGMLQGFHEKSETKNNALVNSGVYLLSDSLLVQRGAPEPASLERDYFPKWLEMGRCIAVVAENGPFLDIGTPESLLTASSFVKTFITKTLPMYSNLEIHQAPAGCPRGSVIERAVRTLN